MHFKLISLILLLAVFRSNSQVLVKNAHLQFNSNSYQDFAEEDTSDFHFKVKNRWLDVFCNKHWFSYNDTAVAITIDPVLGLSYGNDNWRNTRGAHVKGKIAKLSFYAHFTENQTLSFAYINDYISRTGVYPGSGRVRPYNDGWDYAASNSRINFDLNKWFSFSGGYDTHFVGNGFRSLVLDQSNFPYPFFMIKTSLGKVVYRNLYVKHLNIYDRVSPTDGFRSKFGAYQILDWQLSKKIGFSLIQGIVQGNDTLSTRKILDVNYWNPIIFLRPVEFSGGSPDNAIIALNANYLMNESLQFYIQGLVDDIKMSELVKRSGFFQNKLAFQIGAKFKWEKNYWRIKSGIEYNQVRPYVYAHKYTIQNYSHHGESLGHQLGANFHEGMMWAEISFKRWKVDWLLDYYQQGIDVNGQSFGSNIFISDFQSVYGEFSSGNSLLQGETNKVFSNRINISYLINKKNNTRIGLSSVLRNAESTSTTRQANYFNVFYKINLARENEVF